MLDKDHIIEWTQATTNEATLNTLITNPDAVVHPEVDTMECRPTDVPDTDNDETL